jgi:hypothetical protein
VRSGAPTPEELETLLEDAFLLGDCDALVDLFEERAVLAPGSGPVERRGVEQIAQWAQAQLIRDYAYVADPSRIVQAGDTALVFASRGVSVMRRGRDRSWRYAISTLSIENKTTTEES